jgi:glycosyltransferase involved in cell wall biosynthesis
MQKQGGKRTWGISPFPLPGKPTISIVTVTFNAELFLRQALQSIADQNYSNLELILIDGGSTDGTLSIIQEFEQWIDFWITEPDKGIYDAMNKGIQLATGDWVGFKNADDWYVPGVASILAQAIENNPEIDVWYGNSYSVIHESPLAVAPFFTNHLTLGRNPGIDHRSSFVRREMHLKCMFNLKYRLAADFDVFWRLKKMDARFAHLGCFVAYKRYGGASDGTQVLKESFAINEQHAGLLFALYSRARSWFEFVIWKVGNRVLRIILGPAGYKKFKARKIKASN